MKKVLFVATITGHITGFHTPYLKWFKSQGYEVHVASNGKREIEYCDKHYNLPFERIPWNKNNLKVYKELKRIINENKYEIIHCHTPVGGLLTRLAARTVRKNGTKVIYTAHGFHFYKGASLLNWIIYYPIEKWMSYYTDCLVTINEEDYNLAMKKMKAEKIVHIDGVGMDTERFSKKISYEDDNMKRKELGIEKKDLVFTYVAELNKNKNQILLIQTIEKLKEYYPNIKLILVGPYKNKEYYDEEIRKRKLENNVILTGKRVKDVAEILSITDVYLASSIREGLPVNIMEAMYMRLPIIATNNRGHRELVKNNVNGYIVKNDANEFEKAIKEILKDKDKMNQFKNNSYEMSKKYQIENVIQQMINLYKEVSEDI